MKEFNIQNGEGEFIIHIAGDNSKYTVTYDHGQIVFENAGLKYIIPENLGHYATFFKEDPNTGKRKYLLNNVRDLYRDTTPTDFGLGSNINDTEINSSHFTEEIIVGGINESIQVIAPVGVNIYVNGNIVASGTKVDNGDIVKFEISSSSEYETTANYNLTVGDITKSFSITTMVEPDNWTLVASAPASGGWFSGNTGGTPRWGIDNYSYGTPNGGVGNYWINFAGQGKTQIKFMTGNGLYWFVINLADINYLNTDWYTFNVVDSSNNFPIDGFEYNTKATVLLRDSQGEDPWINVGNSHACGNNYMFWGEIGYDAHNTFKNVNGGILVYVK
jgi:hypothetical protein